MGDLNDSNRSFVNDDTQDLSGSNDKIISINDLEKHVSLGSTEKEKSFSNVTSLDHSNGQLDPNLTFPEGGRRAWTVVLGVWIAQFCTFGYTNAYGVYNDFYVREYLAKNYTSSQISWIGSVQLFLVMSVGLFVGRAFDTGYFYHLMIGGSFLLVFSLFMLSISEAEQYYQVFLTQGLGVGIAVGATYIPGVAVISHYFRKRRALAIGIATSGSAVGGAIHPIILNAWFHGSLGFHSGVRASAGLNAVLLIIAICLMKPRLPPSPRKESSTSKDLRVFLRDIPYTITIIGTTSTLAGLYFPFFFIQLNAIKSGVKPGLAFYTIAIMNAGSAAGRIVPNLFVHRFGVYNVIIPCVLIAAILVICTLAVNTAIGTMIFAVLYGFFSGAYVSMLPPMVSSLAKNDGEMGARLGVCFTFTGLGGLVGTPIAGALLSPSFVWWRPILFSSLCVLSGALCFTTTRFLRVRKRGTQWL